MRNVVLEYMVDLWLTLTSRPLYGISIIVIGIVLFFFNIFIGAALVCAGIFIRIKQMERTGPDTVNFRKAKVNGKIYTQCRFCPHAIVGVNVWSNNYPTCQCSEKGGKFNYVPGMIPRWCPNAVK